MTTNKPSDRTPVCSRRDLMGSGLAAGGLLALGYTDSAFGSSIQEELKPETRNGVVWYDVQQWGVEGKGWEKTESYFDRLPSKAKAKVRGPVWSLSRHSAGMKVRFKTNSKWLHVKYKLTSPSLSMYHMPATGVSGVDLYGDDGKGQMRWVAVSRPTAQTVEAAIASNIDPLPEDQLRLFELYLPLYNGVEHLEIGIAKEAKFEAIAPRAEAPIVFYGTSIMHGACASRPGMSISSIVGRRLDKPVINLGFSGNGKMEAELGQLICELNPSIVAVDCLPNMNAQMVKERTEKLVRQIRGKLPNVPILLVEDRSFTNSTFFKSARLRHAGNRKELKAAYDRLTKSGVSGLYYLPGELLLGKDGEGATDGSHPNDLGMVRYADAYTDALKKITDSEVSKE